jgi:hypothetical protein
MYAFDELRRSAPFIPAIIESFIFYGRATLGDRASTLIEKINFAKDEKPYRPATALVKQLFLLVT